MGTSVGAQVFVKFGWRPAAALNMGLYGFQVIVLLLRGPNCKQYTWFGYEGGWESRKSVLAERKRMETEITLESSSAVSSENVNIDNVDADVSGVSGDLEQGLESVTRTSEDAAAPR